MIVLFVGLLIGNLIEVLDMQAPEISAPIKTRNDISFARLVRAKGREVRGQTIYRIEIDHLGLGNV